VDDTTTSPADSGDAGTQDWQRKYSGAQIALNRKHDELVTAQRTAQEATDRASAMEAELDAFRARDAAARQDDLDRETYETLRARYEPEPPTPRHNNGARGPRQAEEDDPWADMPSGKGFPT
jgi:hypothetical protein